MFSFDLLNILKKVILLYWQCVFGPSLYQIYPTAVIRLNKVDAESTVQYIKYPIETLSDRVFIFLNIVNFILQIILPLCLFFSYRNGSLTYLSVISCLKVFVLITIVRFGFMCLRGASRFKNPQYTEFVEEFYDVQYKSTVSARRALMSRYDFSLSHWKPDYTVKSSAIRKTSIISAIHDNLSNQTEMPLKERLLHYPQLLLGYVCVKVFGRRLMFPGSLQIIQFTIKHHILNGRANLIVSHNGQRSVLRTADGNNIDTVFIDKRSTDNGKTLIITCEGNAGFYEVGCMMTPILAGYSVLGWNRPGFAESSGYPSIIAEVNSIDAVIRYAMEKLDFSMDNIVIFAWSIGGYAACWAGAHYQNIRGVVLDGVFDDVLPLAQRQMPAYASKFVEKTIRSYLDVNNLPLLRLYNGPFYLIRRTRDEIMNSIPGDVSSNLANGILYSILLHRYPLIYKDDQTFKLLKQYVGSIRHEKKALFDRYCTDTDIDHLRNEIDRFQLQHSTISYPSTFGESFSFRERECFAVYLVNQYLIDYPAAHSKPLPVNLLHLPRRFI